MYPLKQIPDLSDLALGQGGIRVLALYQPGCYHSINLDDDDELSCRIRVCMSLRDVVLLSMHEFTQVLSAPAYMLVIL
jgi:hypothetical protein